MYIKDPMIMNKLTVSIVGLLCFVILVSCSDFSKVEYTELTVNDVYDVSGTGVFYPETSGYVDLTYNLDLGSSSYDIFFILTNKSQTSSADAHNISGNYISSAAYQNSISAASEDESAEDIAENQPGMRGKPDISAFNNDPFSKIDTTGGDTAYSMSFIEPSSPAYDINIGSAADDEAGDTGTFGVDSDEEVDATCRYTGTASTEFGTKKLNIWVADDCWETGGTKNYQVSSAMITALASEFLNSTDTDDDIYDWVTGIYGDEWGNHDYASQLIGTDDNITILLFDIDGDDVSNFDEGYVAGYFFSKDNFKQSEISYSNERIMFYLDAVAYACPEDSWEITDKRPADTVLTLAHELQHMIHFYQKNVIRVTSGAATATWINEMCSLITEDLICYNLGSAFKGPRGIPGTDPSPTSAGNTNGWLPYYVTDPDSSLTKWNESNLALDYATAYCFGAYLGRNYGGATLFKNIVQNEYTDSMALTTAVALETGSAVAYEDLLRFWGAAVLLSADDLDELDGFDGLIYNRGSEWYDSVASSMTYRLGSINVPNYDGGLVVFTPSGITGGGDLPPSSNRFVRVATGVSGAQSWNIRLDKNVRLTVVVK